MKRASLDLQKRSYPILLFNGGDMIQKCRCFFVCVCVCVVLFILWCYFLAEMNACIRCTSHIGLYVRNAIQNSKRSLPPCGMWYHTPLQVIYSSVYATLPSETPIHSYTTTWSHIPAQNLKSLHKMLCSVGQSVFCGSVCWSCCVRRLRKKETPHRCGIFFHVCRSSFRQHPIVGYHLA